MCILPQFFENMKQNILNAKKNTSSDPPLVSKYHFSIKGSKSLWEMAVFRTETDKIQGKPGESCQKLKCSKKQKEQNKTKQQQMMRHIKGTQEPTEIASRR